jgi:hypothetical protein
MLQKAGRRYTLINADDFSGSASICVYQRPDFPFNVLLISTEKSVFCSDQTDGEKIWTQINAEKRGFFPLDQRLSA